MIYGQVCQVKFVYVWPHHMGDGCKLFVPSHSISRLMNLLELRLILCEICYGLCRLDSQWPTIFSGVGCKLDIDLHWPLIALAYSSRLNIAMTCR